MIFLLFYGLIDFIVTGDYILHLQQYIISNLLVILSDFILICFYEKKISPYLLFYTTLYFCIYMVLVNCIAYLSFQFGINITEFYTPSIIRTLLVVVYNGGTILIFKLLNRIEIAPNKQIVSQNWLLFDIVNIVILSAYIIFFGFSLIEIDTVFIIYIFIIFIVLWLCLLRFLWLCLLRLINRTILLNERNNELLLINMANKNSELLLESFKKDSEEIEKVQHDIGNHLNVIKNYETIGEVREYISEITSDLLNINKNIFNTGNATVDTILSMKVMKYHNIDFIVKTDLNEIKMSPKDIASLLFNLIDNAIENISSHDRTIHIDIVQQNDDLVIIVSNHVDKKPTFKSRKGMGHGYGLKIVDGIVQKYHGEKSVNIMNNIVVIQIILNNSIFEYK